MLHLSVYWLGVATGVTEDNDTSRPLGSNPLVQGWRQWQLQFDVQYITSHFQQLSKGITFSSVIGMACLCLGVAVFSALYESIIASRQYHREVRQRAAESVYVRTRRCQLENCNTPTIESQRANLVLRSGRHRINIDKIWYRVRFHLLQTFLHLLQVVLGFLVLGIMLRYSGWMAVTVLLLSGVGHYLIGVLVFKRPLPTLPTSLELSRQWLGKLIKEHQELTAKIS
ncbi:hypothetical protein BIW11_06991 [Tropilaelaps mercedesae]|uniref:Copper transport protein n=1 Tax=Tropilaelaps mercedesae TaxID=418985 RepID=A0A1V9XW43_9ACAR|nr:hypothetical protein BIW11_06991 [Tropilaelaps mercedesae]